MKNFFKKYILIYFITNKNEYSFIKIAQNLGLPLEMIEDIITEMLNESLLYYNEDNILSLTQKGNDLLYDSKEKFLINGGKINKKSRLIDTSSALDLNHVYVPDGFLSKL